jgi:hypothetical protein
MYLNLVTLHSNSFQTVITRKNCYQLLAHHISQLSLLGELRAYSDEVCGYRERKNMDSIIKEIVNEQTKKKANLQYLQKFP